MLPLSQRHPSRYVGLVVGISLLLLGGWFAWIAWQPACGPPGNTQLAATDRWVPWAFVAAELVLPTAIGAVFMKSWATVVTTVVCAGAVTVLCGGAIWFFMAAGAGCFAG